MDTEGSRARGKNFNNVSALLDVGYPWIILDLKPRRLSVFQRWPHLPTAAVTRVPGEQHRVPSRLSCLDNTKANIISLS